MLRIDRSNMYLHCIGVGKGLMRAKVAITS